MKLVSMPGVGIFLNAYEIKCSGTHRTSRLPIGEGTSRESLEKEIEAPVVLIGNNAYTASELKHEAADAVNMPCLENLTVHAFILREAFRLQAERRGAQVARGFAGEISCRFPQRSSTVGPIVVEPEIRVRIQHEGVPRQPVVVARRSYRWRLGGNLLAQHGQDWVIGEKAIRLAGSGPPFGRIKAIHPPNVVFAYGPDEEATAKAADYAVVITPTLLRRVSSPGQGGELYRRLRIETGAWDRSGRINRYAVKDRHAAVLQLLEQVGLELTLPDGGTARIQNAPVEVRLQATG